MDIYRGTGSGGGSGTRPWLQPALIGRCGFTVYGTRTLPGCWLGGADLQTVRKRLGHDSLRATEKYLHTVPTTTDVALEALARIRNQTQRGTDAAHQALGA